MTDGADTDYEGLLDELGLDEAACVTAATGVTEAEAIRLFGGDPGSARARVLDEELAEELPDDDSPHIAVTTAGPAVVVVEYNGFQGSREEILRPLSRLGERAASAYWNVDALSRLTLAEGGSVLSAFEMPKPELRYGASPEAWDPYLSGLAPGPGEGWGGGLAAVARATGARLDRAWARGTHLVVEIEEVAPALLPQALEESPLLAEEPFAGFLARLEPRTVPEMERYAVELAARGNALDTDPLCTLALAVLDGCGPPEGRAHLRAELAGRAAAARTTGPGGSGARAAEVWQVLGDLLAREEGTPVEAQPPMAHLVRAMTGSQPAGPEDAACRERFLLLEALYRAARRGTPG